jgi:hypothetical protein
MAAAPNACDAQAQVGAFDVHEAQLPLQDVADVERLFKDERAVRRGTRAVWRREPACSSVGTSPTDCYSVAIRIDEIAWRKNLPQRFAAHAFLLRTRVQKTPYDAGMVSQSRSQVSL